MRGTENKRDGIGKKERKTVGEIHDEVRTNQWGTFAYGINTLAKGSQTHTHTHTHTLIKLSLMSLNITVESVVILIRI